MISIFNLSTWGSYSKLVGGKVDRTFMFVVWFAYLVNVLSTGIADGDIINSEEIFKDSRKTRRIFQRDDCVKEKVFDTSLFARDDSC